MNTIDLQTINEEYIESFIERNTKELEIYHAENVAEGVLDDDLSDHFEAWVSELSIKDIHDLSKKLNLN